MTLGSARIATLLVALAAIVTTARAADAPEPARYLLAGHQQVRVADKLDPEAKIYAPAGAAVPRLLVFTSLLPKPVLVMAGDKAAAPVDKASIAQATDDPEAVLLTGNGSDAKNPLAVDGIKLRFQMDGKTVIIEPREPLTGELQPDQILAYMPEYRRNMAAYQPRLGELRLLETAKGPVEIDVFFGTWCPHCEKYLPRLLRVVQELKTPNLKFHFHGVPHKIDDDPLARQFKVNAIPVGILKKSGDTVARIEGTNWERPESALSALLFGDAS